MSFLSDGYLSPLDIMSESEVVEKFEQLTLFEKDCGGDLQGNDRFKTHLLCPWAADIVHNKSLVKSASEALETDCLVCWSSGQNTWISR